MRRPHVVHPEADDDEREVAEDDAHMDLAALVSDAPVLTTMRHDLKSFGWHKKQFDAFICGVGWYELRPKLRADRVLMFAASEDRFFDP